MPPLDPALTAEGARIMTICNACRYCEGYCAVFPAMERRLSFQAADLAYLANLCHNCGSCLPACQYAPPHEFAVNVPQTLAQIRGATHDYRLGSGAATLATAVFVIATLLFVPAPVLFARHDGGAFFQVISHFAMVALFSAAGLYAIIAMGLALRRFWHDIGEDALGVRDARAISSGLLDALRLVNLGGGGEGCTYPTDRPSTARRVFHHLTFYGFLACFAATVVAAFYDNILGLRAPYSLSSVPVVLGMYGGIALTIGAGGLLALIAQRNPDLNEPAQTRRDTAFTVLLLSVAVSGLLLLALRSTPAMGTLLSVHLGLVLGFFVTMPYGKFVHGFYRLAALIRYAKGK
jgi:citrate/tricarballylate utilization protein